MMKPISLHVEEEEYRILKSLGAREDRPVAALIREAMTEYLVRRGDREESLFDLAPHASGELLEPWTRADLADEMYGS